MLEPLGELGHDAQVLVERHQAVEDQLRESSATTSSVPMRGSRLLGPLVMPTTMTFGIGGRALEARRRDGGQREQRRRAAARVRVTSCRVLLELGEQRQRLERRHAIDVERRRASPRSRSSAATAA